MHWREEIIKLYQIPHNDHNQSISLAENPNNQLSAYLALVLGFQNITYFTKRLQYA